MTENEGEFKKRQKELVTHEVNESTKGTPDPYFYGFRDGTKDMLKILEDAKKENPLNPIIEAVDLYRTLKNHTKEEKEIVIREHLKNCNLEQFILEEIEWVVKWLGSAENNTTTIPKGDE